MLMEDIMRECGVNGEMMWNDRAMRRAKIRLADPRSCVGWKGRWREKDFAEDTITLVFIT